MVLTGPDEKELDMRTPPPAVVPVPSSEPLIQVPKKNLSKKKQVEQALAELDKLQTPKKNGAQQVVDGVAGKHKPSQNGGLRKDGQLDGRTQMPHLFRAGDKRTRELAAKGGRKGKVPKFRDVLEKKLEEHAEDFVRPFVEGMKLREDASWSPSTKVNFFINQSILAEKAFDRFEGKPVQRNRNVDKEDNDAPIEVIAGLNQDQAIAALGAIFSGVDQMGDEIEGVILGEEPDE